MNTTRPATKTQLSTGSGGRLFSETGRFVVAIVVVILLLMVALIGFSSGAAQRGKKEDPVTELNRLASAAASAAVATDQAIKAEKVLVDKIREETTAEKTASEHEAKAAKLKAEKSEGAAEWEKTATASRAVADQRKKDRIDAETAVAEASLAVAAARKPLQPTLVETLSEIFATRVVESIALFLLFVGIFPLSAIAFLKLEVPSLMELLTNDRKMLGKTSLSGTGDGRQISGRWDWRSYSLHCCLAIFATAAGTGLFFRTPDGLLDVNTLRGMQLGFLGAYVYSLHLIYRRYTTRDLMPHVYLSCAVGMIAGMIINYFAFAVMTTVVTSAPSQAEFTGVGAGGAAILAFSFGYFPNLAIRWFRRFSRTSVQDRQRRSDALPLSLIDGISDLHESRLLDEGIDNVQNLASVDIDDMIEKTPYSAKQIVEWVDQSILYLYIDPSEIDSLRRAGVRSVSDFRDVWSGLTIQYQQIDGTSKRVPIGDDDFEDRRKSIAQQLATTEERLDCLFRATSEGPNMELIQTYWRNCREADLAIRNSLVGQVCGRVGLALKVSMRDGKPLTTDEVLRQVAEQLFLDVPPSDDVTAESLRGQAYLKGQLSQNAGARKLLEECIRRFPDDPAGFNELAWLELNFLDSRRSTFQNAQKHAQTAVDLAEKQEKADPDAHTDDVAPYLDTLALAEIRLGNVDKGVELVEKAIAKWDASGRTPQPFFLETLADAAEAYLSRGDSKKAQEILERVKSKKYANEQTTKQCAELQQKIARVNSESTSTESTTPGTSAKPDTTAAPAEPEAPV